MPGKCGWAQPATCSGWRGGCDRKCRNSERIELNTRAHYQLAEVQKPVCVPRVLQQGLQRRAPQRVIQQAATDPVRHSFGGFASHLAGSQFYLRKIWRCSKCGTEMRLYHLYRRAGTDQSTYYARPTTSYVHAHAAYLAQCRHSFCMKMPAKDSEALRFELRKVPREQSWLLWRRRLLLLLHYFRSNS